ncbi:MAG: hypothetical protein AB7I79_08020 [Rhizobiaceae bacterium]
MSGIVITAIVTGAIAIAGGGLLLWRLSKPGERDVLVIAAILMIPLQPLAFYFVRLPIDGVVRQALGEGPAYAFAATFYAPLTEEPAKWLVLLIPAVLKALTPVRAVPIALATGLGFGLGEIGFLAEQIAGIPGLADLPAGEFGGFVLERLLVCFVHGAMLLFAFRWFAEGQPFWKGASVGVVAHYLLNFPIYVAGLDILPISPDIWQAAITVYLIVFTLLFAAVVNHMVVGPRPPRGGG